MDYNGYIEKKEDWKNRGWKERTAAKGEYKQIEK